MRISRFIVSSVLILLCTAAQAATTVENIRVWSENGKTRVVLDLSRPAAHNIFTLRGPDRLVVDLKSSRLSDSLKAMPRGTGSVRSIRSAVRANGQLRVVLDLNEAVRSRSFTAGPNSKYGDRLVIDLQRSGSLQSDDAQIQLSLTIPLYQGGRVSAQTRQARYLLDATGQDLDDVQRGVVRQTHNSYRAVIAGIQEVEAFEQASISAESALEATQAGFEVGTRTIVDVLIAEQRKYQAQRDNSVARHAYIIRHLRLQSVAGLLGAEDVSCSPNFKITQGNSETGSELGILFNSFKSFGRDWRY